MHSLKDEGVDMSHVSISRSYAILVGLEAYVKARRRGKKIVKQLTHGRDRLLSPEELAKREEEERDKSESAERERRFLELKQQAEDEDREANKANIKLLHKLYIRPRTPKHEDTIEEHRPKGETKEEEKDPDIQAPGPGPENAIAPKGTRDP